ncbi:MAG: hypothetical protein JWP63_3064 [Candidatus Solibacter sp.]|nr:hypothetical protein [Candidatus Solibacter sp.]
MNPVAIFAACLLWGILTIWVADWWPWSLFQLSIFFLAGWRVAHARKLRVTGAAAALAVAACWPLAQLAFGQTIQRGATWLATLNWWTFLIVFLVAADLCAEARDRRRFLRVMACSGMALAAFSVAQNFGSPAKIFWLFPSGYLEGVMGPFVNRNQYAAWVELLLPVALYLAATERRKALYGTAAAILLGSVIACASRAGSALAIAEVLAVALALAARRAAPRRALALWSLQFALFAALAIGVVGWQGLRDRMLNGSDEVLRVDAVRASVAMVKDRPWTGSGLGTWAEMYPRYAGLDTGVVVNQAHNDWAQWAAEGGLPFVALMMIFAVLLWKPAFRSIYGIGVAAFLLHALVDYPMQQRPALAAWFFAVAGAAYARNSAAQGE